MNYAIKEGGPAWSSVAKPIIWEGCNELVQSGFDVDQNCVFPVSRDDIVMYAQSEEGDLIGVVCVGQRVGRCRSVTLAYVEPSSRRLGVFRALWVKTLERLNCDLTARVSANNQVGRAALEAVGLEIDALVFSIRED